MVAVGELACFGGMPTGRLETGSAFAKASSESNVRFQLSANAHNLSTFSVNSDTCVNMLVSCDVGKRRDVGGKMTTQRQIAEHHKVLNRCCVADDADDIFKVKKTLSEIN